MGNKQRNLRIDINYVAALANLELTPSESRLIGQQLTEVISYVAQLSAVKTQNVKPTDFLHTHTLAMRPDVPEPSLSQDEALANAKNLHNGFIKIGAILNEL